ncbi:GNAT family N-acetyltransferase [Pleionea sp. CnH1-48]|uniref:GNAT family N-acetyltransferase n=1 Tax=Pleionea sp. CnH1-48 TaxID=2954494 RepID=UPI0020978A87|nr:GNAT family N-acetyltransferase [Pleionea sp. CnH1-48]MCO7222787.1 GNAT family N-acetyltransferase [Pleionea sp. CnH1-48]
MTNDYIIRQVNWSDAQQELIQIRQKVFICEQRVDPHIEQDGKDQDCFHVLVTTLEGEAIGTGRITKKGKIGRVAVLLPFRGKGLGSEILQKLTEIAQEQSILCLHLNAQIKAQPFYERHAFVADGPVFMEAGIPHRPMLRHLDPIAHQMRT